MTNNSPPNNFFSLVMDSKDSDKQATEENSIENGVVTDTPENQSPQNTEEQTGNISSSTDKDILDTPATSSDSTMPHDARRVLVHLMRQGSVMASQKAKLFELLCRNEVAIRNHLSEVYLQLILDRKAGVAFVASANSEHSEEVVSDEQEIEETTTLISKRTLSLYDTLILLVLRKHYQDRESAGEQKITIDIERLESYLSPFLPITDHASKDRKKLLARVREMVKRKVLATIRGAEDRYEITPIIRYVVSASFLESMLKEYTLLAQQTEKASAQATTIDSNRGKGIGETVEQSRS